VKRSGTHHQFAQAATLACLAIALATMFGCGSDRMKDAPVEGKVTYQDKPLEFGTVLFQPDIGPPASGEIAPDGTFHLSTYAQGDGAVLGSHRVSISCAERRAGAASPATDEPGAGRSLIPEKYSFPGSSGLTAQVKEANEPFVFALTGELDVPADKPEE
jgi:hypothetical protein